MPNSTKPPFNSAEEKQALTSVLQKMSKEISPMSKEAAPQSEGALSKTSERMSLMEADMVASLRVRFPQHSTEKLLQMVRAQPL